MGRAMNWGKLRTRDIIRRHGAETAAAPRQSFKPNWPKQHPKPKQPTQKQPKRRDGGIVAICTSCGKATYFYVQPKTAPPLKCCPCGSYKYNIYQ